jgi:hypothetical protein
MERQYTRLDEARKLIDEIIKDADAVQHTLRNPMEDFFYERPRIKQVLDEVIS